MSWLSYIWPQTLVETSSPYNKIIRVNEECGRPKLLVNGSRQSGSYIDRLWQRAFQNFCIQTNHAPKNVLLFGVAGGSVIRLVRAMYPDIYITGVDIDNVMVSIGKKYFGLIEDARTKFVIADASKFVHESGDSFDCIIVDLFIGRLIPDFVLEDSFLKKLKQMFTKNGFMVWNYLQELEYEEKSTVLMKKLHSFFPQVSDYRIARNRFFYITT